MALNIGEKKDVVKEISDIASSAQSAVAAEYRGLTVHELSKLRDNARALGVYVKVVKNSLAKIAIKDTSFECMDSSLKGPLIFAFSKEDLGSAAKLVHDFKKDNKLLKPVVVALNGELVDVEKLSQIAALPSKDQAISMLMAVMKLPIEKLARTLAAPNVKLVQTLSAYKIKLEQS